MVTNEGNSNVVIKQELGEGTGDVLYQTIDGRWWKEWHGEELQTGEELKKLKFQ